MDNTLIYNFEEKWAEDIGLPKEVIQRIVNLSDLFEMISDQRLIPFKEHPGWFKGILSIYRLNFNDDQIYLETLYHNDGMPLVTFDDKHNWIIPDPDKGQGRWEKYGQFYCSTDTNGEIYVNYYKVLDISDLIKLKEKEKAVLKCEKISQVNNLKLKDIQRALYQYLCQKDPEDTFDNLNTSDNALYAVLPVQEKFNLTNLNLSDNALYLDRDTCKDDGKSVYIINHVSRDVLAQVADCIKELNRNGVDADNDLFSEKDDWRSQEIEDYLNVNDVPEIDDER
ncbi:hypothetical protein [Eubacterium sp. 1001713B170207_170306_E7]|uniref:hypothetical protein n=1 Tax=Eubacterium sp. 1001713B170207_170306_E7 TaxID=2787097 RepID=UPI00189B83C4|nr:hypothetical protein [Eubacterium sp. 1001713B170207_170306_E7]